MLGEDLKLSRGSRANPVDKSLVEGSGQSGLLPGPEHLLLDRIQDDKAVTGKVGEEIHSMQDQEIDEDAGVECDGRDMLRRRQVKAHRIPRDRE